MGVVVADGGLEQACHDQVLHQRGHCKGIHMSSVNPWRIRNCHLGGAVEHSVHHQDKNNVLGGRV